MHVTSPHSSRGRLFSSLSRSCVFQWFPTGLSFYFTFPALPSSSIYSLLTKHAAALYTSSNIYSAFIFIDLTSTHCIPRVSLDNFVRRKYHHLYTFFLPLSVKMSCDLAFFHAFAFFRLKLLQSGRRFFVLRFNFILTKYSRSHLSRIALYSFASLDLVVSSSNLLFFSLEPSLFIILPAFFRDRFVQCFTSPFASLLPYFPNLPEIVFFLTRDRQLFAIDLPFSQAAFHRTGLLAASSFGMFRPL